MCRSTRSNDAEVCDNVTLKYSVRLPALPSKIDDEPMLTTGPTAYAAGAVAT